MERVASHRGGHSAVQIALDIFKRTHGRARTRDIANAVDLSQRRLIQVFAAEVGLTPRLFGRIRRFQYAIHRSQDATTIDWAQLADECGYFDQSHLIRDFVAFAGVSPDDYRRRQDRLDRSGAHVKRHHLPLAGKVNIFQ